MNPQLNFIFSRRSVRKYQDKEISEEILHDLLEAAMAAPSAVAKDPWQFIVVQRSETLQSMADVLPYGQMLRHAPAALVVCGDIEKANDRKLSYLLQDCSAAIENILLAATTLGLGSCWLGVHPREDRIKGIRKIFDLEEKIIPVSCVALGWPAESPSPRTRFNSSSVRWEK